MPVVHELKTLAVYFDAVERGEKTFEIRRDDRGFQKGDVVKLLRWEADERAYTTSPDTRARGGKFFDRPLTSSKHEAHSLTRRILWILTGGQFGLEPGYVILALDPTHHPASGEGVGHG